MEGRHSCKCFKVNIRKRIQVKRIKKIEEDGKRYMLSLLQYFRSGSRYVTFLQTGSSPEFKRPGRSWPPTKKSKVCNSNEIMVNQGLYAIVTTEPMGKSDSSTTDSTRSSRSALAELQSSVASTSKADGGGRSRAKILPGEIVQFTIKIGCYPINAIYRTNKWHDSKFQFIMPSDQVFIRAMMNMTSLEDEEEASHETTSPDSDAQEDRCGQLISLLRRDYVNEEQLKFLQKVESMVPGSKLNTI